MFRVAVATHFRAAEEFEEWSTYGALLLAATFASPRRHPTQKAIPDNCELFAITKIGVASAVDGHGGYEADMPPSEDTLSNHETWSACW
jgi:hypothetical protein